MESTTTAALVDAYDVDKLPASFRALLDEAAPLPTDTIFVPRRRTWASVALTLVGSSIAVIVGLAVTALALALSWGEHNPAQGTSSFLGLTAAGVATFLGGLIWLWSIRTK